MAAGEYVSVSSQADTENADLSRERKELAEAPEFEAEELTSIYVARGLEPELAREVAQQLMAHDALGSHARDELGIARAVQPLGKRSLGVASDLLEVVEDYQARATPGDRMAELHHRVVLL